MSKDISSYYVERLASQYRNKPKAAETIALLAKAVTADGLAFDLNTAFDLDLAFGDQLDTIGKYVGAPRDVGVVDFTNFFGFVSYAYPTGTDNEHGFTSYTSLSLNRDAVWLRYNTTGRSSSMLPDFSYRQLIKLKIVTNSSDNTTGSIQEQIRLFYPGALQLRDNQDMTMTYFYSRAFQLPTTVLEAYLPRPMGVGITVLEAIGFDVSVDGVSTFTSETPEPSVDFGAIQFANTKTFLLTNVGSSFEVLAFSSSSPVFTVESTTPLVPLTLGVGDTLEFVVKASSAEQVQNLNGVVSILISSAAGLSSFDINVHVSIDGVFLNWMSFDNFDDYANGALTTPSDSWGWALSGTTEQFFPLIATDNFESYANGVLDAPNGGSNWAEAGTTVQYSNS